MNASSDEVVTCRKSYVHLRWRWLLVIVVVLFGCWTFYSFVPHPRTEPTIESALSSLENGDLSSFDQAISSLERHPENKAYVDFLLAVRLLRFGRTDLALRKFSQLSPTGKLREPLFLYTALALQKNDRKSEAASILETLVLENPNHIEAHRWLGIIYYDLGAYDFSIPHLSEVARLVPDDFRPHRLMGLMYRDFEKYTEAIVSYRLALERNPPEPERDEIASELAASLISQNLFDEALEVLLQVHSSAISETLKARCYLSGGRKTEAVAALEVARQLAPEERLVFLLDAEIQSAQGERLRAVEILRRAIAIHPYDAECRYQLGLALRDAGLAEEAQVELANWDRLKELTSQLSEKNFQALSDPRNASIREELADLCEQLGKHDLAIMWRHAAAALQTTGLNNPE